MKRVDNRACAAFTLIEFVLVMALLAVVMAYAAPSLSRFFRQRSLEHEAERILALTRFSQNQAVSQGIPMVIWIDPSLRRYGVEPKTGYPVRAEKPVEFELGPNLSLDVVGVPQSQGLITAMEFGPDGTVDEAVAAEVILEDRWGERLVVAQDTNGWGYEILREEDYALRQSYN